MLSKGLMYTSYFGFTENPFNLTPGHNHKEALDHLRYGIEERKGFIVVTGGIGTGKTTLCRALLAGLGPETRSALIFNAFISGMELLRSVVQELGIDMPPGERTQKDHIDALNRFLLETFGKGENAVLLIDESQNLSEDVLEQVRMLSNLETEKEKLIQIVLVGQPELRELLAGPSLRQLDERVMVRYHLNPLDPRDVRGYVEHRLVVAGGHGNLKFSGRAFKKIYGYARGNPRRINAVCDRALLVAYTREKHTVSGGMVARAVADLKHDMGLSSGTRSPVLRWAARALLLLLVIGLGLGAWRFGDAAFRLFSGIGEEAPPLQEAAEAPKPPAPLMMDDKTSLSLLFERAYLPPFPDGPDSEERQLGLVTYPFPAEYYVLLKKPFRVRAAEQAPGTPRPLYLVIARTRADGAVALDISEKERPVSREFILSNWGGTVSWIFASPKASAPLSIGMRNGVVRRIQETLKAMGYVVDLTGVFDERTQGEVSRFQADFGLMADGIAGPRTLALLNHMREEGL